MSCTLVFVVVTGRAITDASATWPSPARLFAMVVVPVTAVMTAFRARRLSLRQTARLRARLESAPTGGSHGAQILGRTTQAGMAGLMAANTLAAWREARFYTGKARTSLFGGVGKDGWLLGAKSAGGNSRSGATADAVAGADRPGPLNVGPTEAGSAAAPAGAVSGGETVPTRGQGTRHPKDSGKPVPKSLAAMAPRVKERNPETPAHELPHHERERGSDRPAATEGPSPTTAEATKTQQKTQAQRTAAAKPATTTTTTTTTTTATRVAPRRARPPARQPRGRFAARAANSKAARLLGSGGKAGRAVGKAAFNVSLNGPRFGAEAAGRASVRAEAARDRVRTLLGRVDEGTVRWYVETRYPSGTFQRARREAQRRRGSG